MGKTT